MLSPRIAAFAQQIRTKDITPEQVPEYDRNQVQEYLLVLWLTQESELSRHGKAFARAGTDEVERRNTPHR
jgi:hypothetical protein